MMTLPWLQNLTHLLLITMFLCSDSTKAVDACVSREGMRVCLAQMCIMKRTPRAPQTSLSLVIVIPLPLWSYLVTFSIFLFLSSLKRKIQEINNNMCDISLFGRGFCLKHHAKSAFKSQWSAGLTSAKNWILRNRKLKACSVLQSVVWIVFISWSKTKLGVRLCCWYQSWGAMMLLYVVSMEMTTGSFPHCAD